MEFDEEMFIALEEREPVEEPDDFDPEDAPEFIPLKQPKVKHTLYVAS